MLSYQSLMPAGAGTPRYENGDLVSWQVDSATPHPDPCGGQAPALHFLIPLSVQESAGFPVESRHRG